MVRGASGHREAECRRLRRFLHDVRRLRGCTMEHRLAPTAPLQCSAAASRTPPRVGTASSPGAAPPPTWMPPAMMRLGVAVIVFVPAAWGALEHRVKLVDGIRQDRLVPAPQDGEPKRPVERRKIAGPKPPGLALAEPRPRNTGTIGELVV